MATIHDLRRPNETAGWIPGVRSWLDRFLGCLGSDLGLTDLAVQPCVDAWGQVLA